jgi:hypothetical protein
MPTITAPDAPLSTAAGGNAAIVDEKLINLESGHLHNWVFCCFRIALALLVVWVVAQSPLPFT